MGIAIKKEGFTTAGAVTLDIIDSLLANGFKAIFPVDGLGAYTKPSGANVEKFTVTLEATGDVDPLNKTEVLVKQPWRILFQVTDNATMGIFVGSPASLPDSGTIPFTTATVPEPGEGSSTRLIGAKGIVGADYTPYVNIMPKPVPQYFTSAALFQPHWNNKTEGFINRKARVWLDVRTVAAPGSTEVPPVYPTDKTKDVSATYPMSYYLAITPRGVYLHVWEGSSANLDGQNFSWMLVQRPVKRDTGEVVIEGKAPVFCVNSVGNQINRFVVRESDVVDASAIFPAAVDTKDVTAIINEKRQIGVSENNQYIVNYPSRLNTPRYAYTYELDMIGYTSATVVSPSTIIPQRLYGELTDRSYMGMHANQPANNGMRILALNAGGGI